VSQIDGLGRGDFVAVVAGAGEAEARLWIADYAEMGAVFEAEGWEFAGRRVFGLRRFLERGFKHRAVDPES